MESKRYEKFSKNVKRHDSVQRKKKTTEEEQKAFAKKRMQTEEYTVENQQQFIEKINRMFVEGKINSKNIERVKEELYKYPNKAESSLFISELYYAITEKEEKAIGEIDEYIDNTQTLSIEEYNELNQKINDFRKRLDMKEYLSKKEEEEKQKNKKLKQLQRDYSRQIIEKLDKGKIKKEDIPEIIKNLERYPDRTKAIFLITKLHEGFYGTAETIQLLNKYAKITDLTEEEKNSIGKMKQVVAKNKNTNTIKQRQERLKNRRKQAKEKKEKNEIEER